jgi:hypothetical protein
MVRRLAPTCTLVLAACTGTGSRDESTSTMTTVATTNGGSEDSSSGVGPGPISLTGESGLLDTSEGSTGEMTCGEQMFMIEAVPPNVMLVLDKSGSMMTLWDADADAMTPDITRWNSLVNVVDFVVVNFDMAINFGANLFPSTLANTQLGAGACVVANVPEVPVSPENALEVLMGIPAADAIDLHGATPATAGVEAALTHLKTLDPDVGRFMILVTDGAANCSDDADTSMCPGVGCGLLEEYDANVATVIADAFTMDDIPTFVVGIDILDEITGIGDDGSPEVNTFEKLNLVAIAGGKARAGDEKFFNARNEMDLQDALSQIAGQVASCIVPLADPGPLHPDFVTITIAGVEIPRVDDCETEDGWVYVNPDGPYDAIELCGTACEQLADAGTLDAVFGCPPAG